MAWRAVETLGLTHKKMLRAAEQGRPDLERAEMAGIEPRQLVLLDECGAGRRTTWFHARAARGRRERLTVSGALALDGVPAAMSVAATTGTCAFLAGACP